MTNLSLLYIWWISTILKVSNSKGLKGSISYHLKPSNSTELEFWCPDITYTENIYRGILKCSHFCEHLWYFSSFRVSIDSLS